MPRPRNPNPQPKKYIVKQKLKNGGYHVLERTTVFDPDRRQMKVLSSRLIGKLEPGQTDLSQMVETDKFYSRNKKKGLFRHICGLTPLPTGGLGAVSEPSSRRA